MDREGLIKNLTKAKEDYHFVCSSRDSYINNHSKFKKRKRIVNIVFWVIFVILVLILLNLLFLALLQNPV